MTERPNHFDIVGSYCAQHGLVIAAGCACPNDDVIAIWVGSGDTRRFAVAAGENHGKALGTAIGAGYLPRCCGTGIYYCPVVNAIECPTHGGYGPCCHAPDGHIPLQDLEAQQVAMRRKDSTKGAPHESDGEGASTPASTPPVEGAPVVPAAGAPLVDNVFPED